MTEANQEESLPRRTLGRTDLDVSILGFGGFHILEISADSSRKLLNSYLDAGGNYVETSINYGDGESEKKMGPIVSKRREEMVLASKAGSRDHRSREEIARDIDRSLANLGTDYLDLLFMHSVEDEEQLRQVLETGGGMEAVRQAQEEGKVGHVGISMHGQPDVLIEALKTDEFDVVMATLNYFDRFNFPKLEDELLPLAQENDVGVVLMKPIADGFLWRSAEKAFQYAFSLPVSVVVTGMNKRWMLEEDLKYARNFVPMTTEEKQALFQQAPELGNYVCRQCDECYRCPEGIDIKEVFKLEGYYDRQMRDGNPRNPEKFALRDRLRFWFGNDDRAQAEYEKLAFKADQCTKCGECLDYCPYDIPIIKKLQIAHYKLSKEEESFF